MRLWLLSLSFFPLIVSALRRPQTHGVHPSILWKYKPEGSTWTCLDGSKTISWTAVNDDYCDCPDGSDEPGTSACPQNSFYCMNEGHIGASIPSSRVNDRLCEPACCDGSDEPTGVCENTCATVGNEYRKEQEAARKLRRTGSKIRSTYVSFAQKEKKRLVGEIENFGNEIALQEKELTRLKGLVDRTEALSEEVLEHKMKSPLYTSLITHHNVLKALQRQHQKHLEREKHFGNILDNLRRGYNPNYQDMAVLEAVRGWEQLAHLPPIGEAELEEGSDEEEEATTSVDENEEQLEEGEWTSLQLQNELDELLGIDYVSLLMEHDAHVDDTSFVSSQHNISAYLPDMVIPVYEILSDILVSWLQTLGLVKGSFNAASDATRARERLNDAERNLNSVQKQLEIAKEDLRNLFDPAWYGAEGEWKKLHGTCLTKDTGDYVYEVCLFEEAKQKPNYGGSTFSLGRFASWKPSAGVTEGSAEYYSTQVYRHGTRCWNGPERNVKLNLTCGTENALLTVVELEKCEYLFTGTTPALCLPLDEDRESGRDEL